MTATDMLRRVFCLPPAGAPVLAADDPRQALRDSLYPIVLLYTAAYLGLELREFFTSTPSRFLTPEMYTGLLAVFAGDHELRRWTGDPDRRALSAEFVIYAWWLSFLALLLWLNLRPDPARQMPADLAPICKQVLVVFFGSGASKYFHFKARV